MASRIPTSWPDGMNDEEAVHRLESVMIAACEGNQDLAHGREYKAIRGPLVRRADLADVVPKFVRSERNLASFWAYIRGIDRQWEARREHVWAAFRPLLDRVEGRTRVPASSSAWTGRRSAAQQARIVLALAPDALLGVELLIDEQERALHNGGPASAERDNAIRLLRELHRAVQAEGGEPVITGVIPGFDDALAKIADARALEADERDKAADIVFRAVWKEAEPLFVDDATAPDACPVCATPVDKTTAGSVPAIRNLLADHLDDLKTYGDAKKALDIAETAATQAHNRLVARLPAMIDHLDENDGTGFKTQLVGYQAGVASWPEADAPGSAQIVGLLASALADLDQQIANIEAKQGDHTWAEAKTKIDRLLALQDEVTLATRTSEELAKLNAALTAQLKQISDAIREKVQSLLDTLQTPMNTIYKEIQGEGAKPIRLELPDEDDTNQQRLQLVIDFAENRASVPPGGYLSDSQIHSVALALRLAAIKQFNTGAPVIALDDVVTSYDADHRRAIGALIAKMFADLQIILVTHDERFFNQLKDQLAAKDWQFTRIIGLDPAYGPRFADHKVTDEMIEARWAKGQSAANEMRQAEEEWLLGMARGFGVNVRIRQLEKAYSYERAELASAIGGFLSSIKLSPADVPGVNNRFIASLIKGDIENFGSHFQDGPYGDGSTGDEKTRWEEFKAFRSQFSCVACGRTKFQRPFALNKPVCAHGGCETPFAFALPPAPAVAAPVTM